MTCELFIKQAKHLHSLQQLLLLLPTQRVVSLPKFPGETLKCGGISLHGREVRLTVVMGAPVVDHVTEIRPHAIMQLEVISVHVCHITSNNQYHDRNKERERERERERSGYLLLRVRYWEGNRLELCLSLMKEITTSTSTISYIYTHTHTHTNI